MKLHILSDLHIEFTPFELPETDADLIILAGDIHVGKRGMVWVKELSCGKPVIYVAGNHEFYRAATPKLVDDLREMASGTDIHLLENESLTIGNVTFFGCTMWSDFNLLGDQRLAMIFAGEGMNDYRHIRVSPVYRKLKPLDTAAIHTRSRLWLEKELAETPVDNKRVVITHHAPNILSIPEVYRKEPLVASYASDMSELMADFGIGLWIHGHMHNASDYCVEKTRVICNPRGYPDQKETGFQPGLVIDLDGIG